MPTTTSSTSHLDYRPYERRLRRQATRQGLQLVRSRSRSPHAVETGGYMLLDPMNNGVVAGGYPVAYGLRLDDVETYLDPSREWQQ